jgi:hypothetical protein
LTVAEPFASVPEATARPASSMATVPVAEDGETLSTIGYDLPAVALVGTPETVSDDERLAGDAPFDFHVNGYAWPIFWPSAFENAATSV